MSMTPENVPDRFTEPPRPQAGPSDPLETPPETSPELRNEAIQNASGGAAREAPFKRAWQGRLLGISFAIFAFEIGLFLVIFPWMGDAWDLNSFESMAPVLRNVWDEPYFRGAVSGLGFVNIYIAMLQIVRLFRRSS